MSIKALILPLLLAVLFVTPTRGATTGDKNSAEANGSLSGTIKDTAGAVLQDAQIVLQPTGTAAASNAQGNYLFRNLRSGSYTVTVSYAGFTTSNTDVDVSSGQTTQVNVTLTVGATSQQVVVSANLEAMPPQSMNNGSRRTFWRCKPTRRSKAFPMRTSRTRLAACPA
jgi:hypothetical protein